MWLADANPTTASAVFGVEKSDVINLLTYQHKTWYTTTVTADTAAGTVLALTAPAATA